MAAATAMAMPANAIPSAPVNSQRLRASNVIADKAIAT